MLQILKLRSDNLTVWFYVEELIGSVQWENKNLACSNGHYFTILLSPQLPKNIIHNTLQKEKRKVNAIDIIQRSSEATEYLRTKCNLL